jgi:hypothetical protein
MQITTLIPAYKSKYLGELLNALRFQTVRPSRVIFSDDSPDEAFLNALNSESIKSVIAELNIEVVKGPRSRPIDNFFQLLDLYGGRTELYHFLLDDDIIYPQFYERHLHGHSRAHAMCSVSRRWTALESGQPVASLTVPPAVNEHAYRLLSLAPENLFPHTVGMGNNWLGELSNAVFRAEMAQDFRESQLNGISFVGLEDIGAFLAASLKAPLVFINEFLGFFRTSPAQHTAQINGRQMKLAHLAWIALAIAARDLGYLSPDQCSNVVRGYSKTILSVYSEEPDLDEICAVAKKLLEGDGESEKTYLALHEQYGNRFVRKAG